VDGHISAKIVKIAIRVPIPKPDSAITAVINAKYQPTFFGINKNIIEMIPKIVIMEKRLKNILKIGEYLQ
jgi:hypothetical protein